MSLLSLGQRSLARGTEQLLERVEQLLSLAAERDGQPAVVRLAVEIDPLDPLLWLAAQPNGTKLYWRGRKNGSDLSETAGIGLADQIIIESAPINFSMVTKQIAGRLRKEINDLESRYYGGFQFHNSRDHADNSLRDLFPAARFLLPRFELVRTASKTELAVNLILPTDSTEALLEEIRVTAAQILSPNETDRSEIPTVIGRTDRPTAESWSERVEQSIKAIKSGELQKIVLARRSTFTFSRPLNPWQLLQGFRESEEGRFLFGFQPEKGTAFISASPELLYRRQADLIDSEALAGTRPRGDLTERDLELGEKLLNSVKERREHRFVEEHISEALNRHCQGEVTKSEVALVKLPHVQHLISRFKGRLKDGVVDADLLAALHPTPAVGGLPQELATAMIFDLETFDRGWYASPIGWIGADGAEFSVGIRSGLLQSNSLTLYSGAGIVEGSIPRKEWDEIENKIAGFLSLLTK